LNQSGGAVVVQLDELERNKMAPDATPTKLNKWQNSAVYARFFRCITVRPEPPKLRAGGVGVGGSNPLVPTKISVSRKLLILLIKIPHF
jgi:hypothetical protein